MATIKYDFFGKCAAALQGNDFVDAVERGMPHIAQIYGIGNAAGYKIVSMSASNGYLGGDSHGVLLQIQADGLELANGKPGESKTHTVRLVGPALAHDVTWAVVSGKLCAVEKMTMGQLDDIMQRTEYADKGVAVGDAAADQDLRRAAQKELGIRMGYEA